MKKANRPYYVGTETCSAWYETLQEAQEAYMKWINFYIDKPQYGNREITLKKNSKTIISYDIAH